MKLRLRQQRLIQETTRMMRRSWTMLKNPGLHTPRTQILSLPSSPLVRPREHRARQLQWTPSQIWHLRYRRRQHLYRWPITPKKQAGTLCRELLGKPKLPRLTTQENHSPRWHLLSFLPVLQLCNCHCESVIIHRLQPFPMCRLGEINMRTPCLTHPQSPSRTTHLISDSAKRLWNSHQFTSSSLNPASITSKKRSWSRLKSFKSLW